MSVLLVAGVMACAPDQTTGTEGLPTGVPDPSVIRSPSGAVAAYRGALQRLVTALNTDTYVTGLMSDEMSYNLVGAPVGGQQASNPFVILETRMFPSNGSSSTGYADYQRVRSQSREAIGLLSTYRADSSAALIGHLYALQGYAEIMLADVFCSGIPLSTVDYNGDYTLAAGSSTREVYQHAIALFDSTLARASDSVRIMRMAQMGKARALLALGEYAEAATVVHDIPTDFRYYVFYQAIGGSSNFARYNSGTPPNASWNWAMADQKGINGLNYITAGDPRVQSTLARTNNGYGHPQYHPDKYASDGGSPIVLADGIEARLIEAEAALSAGDPSWLTILNTVRTDGTMTETETDSTWTAGTGGVAGLEPLDDPGDDAARVDLLFRERGFWLYLTGHRFGDLRRLVRQYQRLPDAVFPTGAYEGGTGVFGADLNARVPSDEQLYNPNYQGCINRDA